MNCSARTLALCLLYICLFKEPVAAQYVSGKGNDATTPLHLSKPDYVTPYGETTPQQIKAIIDRVYHYLDTVTPMQLIDKTTKAAITDLSKADSNTIFQPGDFRLFSYEWGVTYRYVGSRRCYRR